MRKKKIVKMDRSFPNGERTAFPEAAAFVRDALRELGIREKLSQKTELLCEEALVLLERNAETGTALQVRIRRFFGDTEVSFSSPGKEFDPYSGGEEDMSEDAIRALLLRSFGEKFKYRHKNGVNHIRIQTGQSELSANTVTFFALALGLLFGVFVRFVLGQSAGEAVSRYALTPVRTIFMNGLSIVIAPVVFFSIVTCFSQFHSLADFGKLGAKVFGMYMLTTVIAVLVGIGMFSLFRPGTPGFALTADAAETAGETVRTDVEIGVLPMLMGIVPDNFLAPFLESNTLQIIFLAVLCGVAVGMIGQYSAVLNQIFEACGSLFLMITTLIAKLIPLAAFASVALMVIHLGGDSLLAVLGGGAVEIGGLFVMLCVYGLLILLIGRTNPLTFFKKIREGMLTSFSLSSSSAAMPTNLRICTEKLGVSPKVANFSIPLGATINMDGSCIYLTVFGLFIARAYGMEISASAMISMVFIIILLSLGSPGVPGAGLICLGVVLETLVLPVEAVGLAIAVNPILDMFNTLSNTTGDMATALIVAKSENLLDTGVFGASESPRS